MKRLLLTIFALLLFAGHAQAFEFYCTGPSNIMDMTKPPNPNCEFRCENIGEKQPLCTCWCKGPRSKWIKTTNENVKLRRNKIEACRVNMSICRNPKVQHLSCYNVEARHGGEWYEIFQPENSNHNQKDAINWMNENCP